MAMENLSQYKHIVKGGGVKDCEFSVTKIKYNGEDAALGVVRDVTEKLKAERLIEENERFLSIPNG